jgi:HAD superfamily hydrolase (TIGR01509 family)
MNAGIRLVIFDSDGVLVDSEPIAARVLAQALTELGCPHTAQQCIERYTGISMAAVLAKIEAGWGRPLPAGFREILRERDVAAFRAQLRPVAGVPEMLRGLRLPKCVASSGAPQKMRVTLGVTGLLPFFEPNLFSAEMVARGKPAPDLFLLAAQRMGAAPEACAVVEDSVAGIQAARAAGMQALGFAGGGHAGPGYAEGLRTAGAHLVFDRMADLPAILAG